MAHGGGAHGGGGNNNSAVASHVGLFTALALIGGVFAAGWLVVKQPKTAGKCVLAALGFACITANPATHPLLGLVAIIIGFCLVRGD